MPRQGRRCGWVQYVRIYFPYFHCEVKDPCPYAGNAPEYWQRILHESRWAIPLTFASQGKPRGRKPKAVCAKAKAAAKSSSSKPLKSSSSKATTKAKASKPLKSSSSRASWAEAEWLGEWEHAELDDADGKGWGSYEDEKEWASYEGGIEWASYEDEKAWADYGVEDEPGWYDYEEWSWEPAKKSKRRPASEPQAKRRTSEPKTRKVSKAKPAPKRASAKAAPGKKAEKQNRGQAERKRKALEPDEVSEELPADDPEAHLAVDYPPAPPAGYDYPPSWVHAGNVYSNAYRRAKAQGLSAEEVREKAREASQHFKDLGTVTADLAMSFGSAKRGKRCDAVKHMEKAGGWYVNDDPVMGPLVKEAES